jgi:hypothetical protein
MVKLIYMKSFGKIIADKAGYPTRFLKPKAMFMLGQPEK